MWYSIRVQSRPEFNIDTSSSKLLLPIHNSPSRGTPGGSLQINVLGAPSSLPCLESNLWPSQKALTPSIFSEINLLKIQRFYEAEMNNIYHPVRSLFPSQLCACGRGRLE